MRLSKDSLVRDFTKLFGARPDVLVRAAGRVNLIGEHTDYNDGYVLPAAIDRYIYFVARKRTDPTIRAYATEFGDLATFAVEDGTRDPTHRWTIYMKGVIQLLLGRGIELGGADVLVAANLPRASGLSSSAAMEVGTAVLFQALYPFAMDDLELIRLTQQAEHQFAGTKCGIMDMFIGRLGKRDHALFLDCRNFDYEHIPLKLTDTSIVICDSRKKRGLVESAYNERRAQCEEGVRILQESLSGITALRDVSEEDLKRHAGKLSELVRRRCEHVVHENARVIESVEALRRADLHAFGALMADSHTSLRDLYEVSCPELDLLVEVANEVKGTIGARMTGAGFGGCTVNLVRDSCVEDFEAKIAERYFEGVGRKPGVHVCRAEDGVLVERL